MIRTTMHRGCRPHLLAIAVASGFSAQANAVSFNIGEVQGQFDSSLSVGASWAVRGPDPDFISSFNSQGKRGEASTRVCPMTTA